MSNKQFAAIIAMWIVLGAVAITIIWNAPPAISAEPLCQPPPGVVYLPQKELEATCRPSLKPGQVLFGCIVHSFDGRPILYTPIPEECATPPPKKPDGIQT